MSDLPLIAREIERSLYADLLDRWFPLCVSEAGGYHQDFSIDWQPEGEGGRSLVFQSRMAWITATVALEDAKFEAYARHGLSELAEHFIDPQTGVAFWGLDANRRPTGAFAYQRHAYGHAFAIYALAALARLFSEALPLAQTIFAYLEANHYDHEFGGYFEATDASGQPILERDGVDAIGTPYGWKSQNTHLHLLEAYAELYRVWPDARLGERLSELVDRFLGPLYVEDGWLHVYIERDWTPAPGPVSHGHDVEAAHLILDAARALGRGEDEEVRTKCQALIDYALRTGCHEAGGFYYAGDRQGTVTDRTKNWWVQAEGLLGLAAIYQLTRDPRYADALAAQWAWIRDHQIDPAHGGWLESVAPDGTPQPPFAKGHAWKAAYHDGRALFLTSRYLDSLD
jgi:mannobiose 2-epimerase